MVFQYIEGTTPKINLLQFLCMASRTKVYLYAHTQKMFFAVTEKGMLTAFPQYNSHWTFQKYSVKIIFATIKGSVKRGALRA